MNYRLSMYSEAPAAKISLHGPFDLVWTQNGSIIHGLNAGVFNPGSLVFPVSFPGNITDPLTVTLESSALMNGTFDILSNVRFYLTGDPSDLSIVQASWPALGNSFTPPQPQMSGGLEICFDGITWIRFVTTGNGVTGVGDQDGPASLVH